MKANQQGFTLIELLVVIAIIGILSAVAVPQYQKYVEKAQGAKALATVSSFKTAVEAEIFSGSAVATITGLATGIDDFTITESSGAYSLSAKVKDAVFVTMSRTAAGAWSCQTTTTANGTTQVAEASRVANCD